MFDDIRADIEHFHQFSHIGSRNIIRLIWDIPELKALMIYRLGRWLKYITKRPLMFPIKLILTIPYWVMVTYIRLTCDIYLEQSADIGPGLYIGHFGGIRLSHCSLGSYCSIQQQVHLGPVNGGSDGPIIGDRVWIGAHAKVHGPIQIRDGATIGAGAIVIKDVDENCLMLGNPARLLHKNYDNSTFL